MSVAAKKYSLSICLILLLFSCKDEPIESSSILKIEHLSPTHGERGTQVLISGYGFSDVESENIVLFNGVQATVSMAHLTQMLVIVPEKAGTGSVTVTVNEITAIGPTFHYEDDPIPNVTSINPTLGIKGTRLKVRGTGFSYVAENNKVTLNGTELHIISASPTEIVVLVPPKSKDGPVAVTVGNKTSVGPVFDYIETYTVSTLAGSGVAGRENGIGTAARFNAPTGVAVDPSGNLYVVDKKNSLIRKINQVGEVSDVAGNPNRIGFSDGVGAEATFKFPTNLILDELGNLLVADTYHHRIRKVSPAGEVTTIAGSGNNGHIDGYGVSASFVGPYDLALDSEGYLYVADVSTSELHLESSIRVMNLSTGRIAGCYGTSGYSSYIDGEVLNHQGKFVYPSGLTIDAAGHLYVAEHGFRTYYDVGDASPSRIRKVTPQGVSSTIAGAIERGFIDGHGANARLNRPVGIAVDADGNLYVGDSENHCIRKITPEGVVTTVAGNGQMGHTDGLNNNARFNLPRGIAIDGDGVIYVADEGNHSIRKITVE